MRNSLQKLYKFLINLDFQNTNIRINIFPAVNFNKKAIFQRKKN
jgi:hypothetical protein